MAASKSSPCPCTSGKKYGECCAPLHARTREPEHGEELVRSRYSAFALGEIEYLWATLHDSHPDKSKGKEKVLFALRTASSTFRYMGLVVVEVRGSDEAGISQVLYLARIFRKGTDVSFLELADFAREGGGLRYLRGKTADASGMRAPPPGLSIDTFQPSA